MSVKSWSLTLTEEHWPRVFENIFGPKKDEVTGKWRRLHNEELYDVNCSPDIIPVIKRRRIHTRFWCGNLNERDHLEDLRVSGKIILKCVLRKCAGKA
jgi:hypothetical protein